MSYYFFVVLFLKFFIIIIFFRVMLKLSRGLFLLILFGFVGGMRRLLIFVESDVNCIGFLEIRIVYS